MERPMGTESAIAALSIGGLVVGIVVACVVLISLIVTAYNTSKIRRELQEIRQLYTREDRPLS
ncbi:hypothetical protein JS278_00280 [Acidipropionibacterium virtanenii]|uniref:Uncharacterized protein n=2 Tax=Acidipropionibacterium virtanenii TaxID=2057246 RepID=A0A344UQC9_9ACTN|nr:hypothetical protein JS278_00280 [Acidipropionibacterium virtanenii]